MKKTILTIAIALIGFSAFSQEKPKPARKAIIKLEVDEADKGLLLFALGNAPLMKTTTPANQVEDLYAKLQVWFNSANDQFVKNFPVDTAKKSPKK